MTLLLRAMAWSEDAGARAGAGAGAPRARSVVEPNIVATRRVGGLTRGANNLSIMK